ncbi:MAG TPA: hypothetical protein VGF23_03815 [Gaiellaceae bacterium]
MLDLATGAKRVAMTKAGAGPVHWSGDGKLVSSGGRIAGGRSLPTHELVWAPTGERAAYVTRLGGIVVWSASGGRRVAPDGWGATSLAWSANGRLAVGRALFGPPPHAQSIWVWDGRTLRRTLALKPSGPEPYPVAWLGSRVVWWAYPDSASIAADGVFLYANRDRIGSSLMFPDFVVPCGSGLAVADGGDRYSTHGKTIVAGGRDVSRDTTRSWVSPSCSADGSTVVAAAGPNVEEMRFGQEHRAIWRLLPTRKQLTRPPAGWTDESPRVLPDGSVLFVRTRQTSTPRKVTTHATLELLAAGKLKAVADLGYTAGAMSALGNTNYYGHYGWPSLLAVS